MTKRVRRSGGKEVAIAPTDQRETVSISKIKNGYLIEKSGVRRGKYYSEREFSAAKPVVSAPAAKPITPEPVRRQHSRPAPAAPREVGFLRGQ